MASNNNLEHTDIPTNTNSEDEASQTTTPDAVYNLPVNIPPPASTPNNSLDFLIYVSPESISTVSTVTSPELLISSSAITSGETYPNSRQSKTTRTNKRPGASLSDNDADQNSIQKKKPKMENAEPSKSKIWRDNKVKEIDEVWLLVEDINNKDNAQKRDVTGRLAILQHYGRNPEPCKSYKNFAYLQELEKTSEAEMVSLKDDKKQKTNQKQQYFVRLQQLKKDKEKVLNMRRELIVVLDEKIRAMNQVSTNK